MWSLKILHEKNWRVSLCAQELHHPPNFPWILAATPGFQNLRDLSGETKGVPVLSWSPFKNFLVGFWLAWRPCSWLDSRQTTGVPVLSSTLKLDTSTGDGSFYFRSSFSPVSLSLDVAVVGEEDELEEEEEQCLSCLEGVIEVEWWEPEEELVDKPGTTKRTKFSVFHCIRIPFLMRCGFWPLIHWKEYPFSSQSSPSDNTVRPKNISEFIPAAPKNQILNFRRKWRSNSSERDFFETFWANSPGGVEGLEILLWEKFCSFFFISSFSLSFFPFIFSLLFHLVSSIVLLLLSSSLSSLVFLLLSSLFSSLLLSCPSLFPCIFSYVSLSMSLFLSLSLCLRVMLCVVLCGVCRCGRGVVLVVVVCVWCVFLCLVCVCVCVLRHAGKT